MSREPLELVACKRALGQQLDPQPAEHAERAGGYRLALVILDEDGHGARSPSTTGGSAQS